ncbi:cation-translocating P-type ATPase [Auraticoccus monumenti]|uniref:cation-translocating P-type ATPase n=1 Tax=Auraticoccus monumenti TaxID=675864 RepID=UPI001E3D364A|nr:cation-translocating P-type ATPase [Auraticoccus monumenti]
MPDLLAAAGTDAEAGLTGQEAARRLADHGPNELRGAAPVPLWRRVATQFQEPLVYLLLAAVVVSVVAWAVEGARGVPVDAVVIAVVVLLNGVIGLVQESRADTAVAALQQLTTATSTVLRDGRPLVVAAADLVPGDVLVLAEGDAVGADARLSAATGLKVSEASLTGESAAVTKEVDALVGTVALGDRVNMVFKGTAVVQGGGRAVVTATGMDTEMGAIAEMLEATVEDPSPLQQDIARVSTMLGITVVVIAVVVMAVTFLVNDVSSLSDVVTVLLLGVSLAVAAVPEGLPAILSVVLAIGVQRMARRNAIVKKLHSVETLGSASVIASDKTGTLTKNEMTIERVVTASGEVRLTGAGYRPEGSALVHGRPVEQADAGLLTEARMVLAGGSLSNNAWLEDVDGEVVVHGDPTEAAFLAALPKLPGARETVARYRRRGEVPFTSERKMMSTLQLRADDRAVRVVTKGAPDVLLSRCTGLQVGDDVVGLTEDRRRQALADVEALSAQAFRTLGVAYAEVAEPDPHRALEDSVEQGLVYVGTAGIIDPPRPEVADAVREAHRAGIRVLMITGDHPGTAARIATDLGIITEGEGAVTGPALDELDGPGLTETTRRSSVYARVAPQHKLAIVDALQADGHVVAMTGDGVNDAPALKSADIGIAMGITGTEVTKQAARMILADDDFATIVAAVRQGRTIFENIKKFLRYLLSSNMGEVATVFFGVVLASVIGLTDASAEGVVVPLLATQILWINLVTDSTPALAMGVDPEVDDVMARRPRDPGERIIDGRMWSGILMIGLVMGVLTLLTIDVFLPGGLVEGADSLEVARTAGFTTLVLAQLFNVFNSRSETTSAFRHLFANRWLWGAVALSAALQVAVVHVPFLQVAFGTADLDLRHWLLCLAMASGVLWFDELRKLVLRRRG